jgi:hypothetical protein
LLCHLLLLSQLSIFLAQDAATDNVQNAVARAQAAGAGSDDRSSEQQLQQQQQRQQQQQQQQQQQDSQVQPSGQYTVDPDCRGSLAQTNPNCGFWPHPKPRPGGGDPPSPRSPPPPDGGDGVYTVLVNNLVGDTDTCEAAGRRSIAINVKSNMMTLPGVRAASLVVDVTCTPGSGGSVSGRAAAVAASAAAAST